MVTLLTVAAAFAAEPISVSVEVGRPSHGVVVGVVESDVDSVLDVIMDCDGTDRWFPELVGTHTLSNGRCAGSTNLPWPVTDRTWNIEVSPTQVDGGAVVDFAYVEGTGNLAQMHGQYRLEALDGGRTRVTYEAWIDLGFWVPDPLVSWATRRVLPGILTGLESEATEARLVASLR